MIVYKAVQNLVGVGYMSAFDNNPRSMSYTIGTIAKTPKGFPMCCYKTYRSAIRNYPRYTVLKCVAKKQDIVKRSKVNEELYAYIHDSPKSLILVSKLKPIEVIPYEK